MSSSIPVSPRDLAIGMVRDAIANLANAHSILTTANPMAADVPAVQKLVGMGKDLGPVMQEISKLRGL